MELQTRPGSRIPYIAYAHGPELVGATTLPFLEYDGANLEQRVSEIESRNKDVFLETRFSRNVEINIPIASAPMATVTSPEAALALAMMGGIGVLPRHTPIEAQRADLIRVKTKAHIGKPIAEPVMLTESHTKADALAVFDEARFGRRIGSIIVVNSVTERRIRGIVTPRDTKGTAPADAPLTTIMSAPCVTAPTTITLEEAERLLRDVAKKKQLPLVDAEGRLSGLITLQDIDLMRRHPHAAVDAQGRLRCAVALGLHDYRQRADALAEAEPDAFVLDVAHGGMQRHFDAVKKLKSRYRAIDIVAANVHTPELMRALVAAGADGIRVGIGPGAVCTTRRNTGIGGSQLTAVLRCAEVADGIPVIADGGIRHGGDIAKALAAGASCVMIGTLFAGTDEAPGERKAIGGVPYKKHFGMASDEARTILRNLTEAGLVDEQRLSSSPEGRDDVWIPYRGSIIEAVETLLGYLRSGMSYLGATTIPEMPRRARFEVVRHAS